MNAGTEYVATVRFRVTDPELFLALAKAAIEQHGGGIEFDAEDGAASFLELFLFSNPDVAPGGFLDYGVELIESN